jgi:hypothetical protein
MTRTRLAGAAMALGLSAAAATASAQPSATLDRFRPAETPEDDFHLSRPTDLGHLRMGAQLTLDYGLNPLVYEDRLGDASSEALAVVEHQLTGTVGLSLGLFDRVVVYAGLPVVLVEQGASPDAVRPFGAAAAGGTGLGDAYLGARARLLGEPREMFALAIGATLTFPTSDVPNAAAYRGEPTVTLVPELLGELRLIPNAFRIVANVGARIREESQTDLSNLQFGHELHYGVGVVGTVWSDSADEHTHLDVHGQIYGDSAFAMIGQREGTALEAIAGLRFFHASGVVAGLAAGPGLARGFGSPDVRVIATVGWAMPAPTPVPDRDGDGLNDDVDACPDEPEDLDQFEDTNGCPDPDNDADGIPDTADACPLEPETVNSFEDENGCPDEVPDTDGDGLRDDVDACPEGPRTSISSRTRTAAPTPTTTRTASSTRPTAA